jgi:hypothetical protein
MSNKISQRIFVSLLILVATVSCRNGGIKWKGTIETVDGMIIVSNPDEAMYHDTILSLKEEVIIHDDEEEGGLIFSMLASIDVDAAGKIYVADQQEGRIHVFDSLGSHILSFGDRGQGPGEMALPFSISITPRNEILVNDWMLRRVSYYTSDGKFIRQVTSAPHLFLRTKSDSEGNLIGSFFIPGKSPQVKLEKFSSKLEPLLTIGTASMPPMPEMSVFIPHIFWKIIEENEFYGETSRSTNFRLPTRRGIF